MPRKPSKKSQKKTADTLFSKLVRSRGFCEGAGVGPECAGVLQCAHIVSRRYLSTRWDEDNAYALCSGHHFFWTTRPLEWESFVLLKMGAQAYLDLKNRALEPWDRDIQSVLDRLKAAV